MKRVLLVAILGTAASAQQPFLDSTHASEVFGQPRNYRIILPPDYQTSGKRYPVIYYLHGHSDRYTVERYDNGTDTIPKMADFVSKNDVIVVSVDGYVAKDYTGFYGGSPWDVRIEGGNYDFGKYFLELVRHIDTTYRTRTDRRHRAISGLSMGGFMSLFLSARYPDLLGSASSFNPGPEFFAGDKGRRSLWRPKDHVRNHEGSMVRLIRASGDYISQYHEETRDAYARAAGVDFEYRRDEFHKHWATSIGETFGFHVRAFSNPKLNNVPDSWSHANPYGSFELRGYRVESNAAAAGITYLDDVTQGGLRIGTRQWAPDGPPVKSQGIHITSAPLYVAGASYVVLDYSFATRTSTRKAIKADAQGRLSVPVDGSGHQLSFIGPGTGAQPPLLLPLTTADRLRVAPGIPVKLPLRVYNPRNEEMKDVRVTVTSAYPTVTVETGAVTMSRIAAGAAEDLSDRVRAVFTAGQGYFAPARLRVTFTYDEWHQVSEDVDVLITPEHIPAPLAVEVLDGRTMTFDVFRQKGNQGGGSAVRRHVTEGKGNGNGVLEPGEEATVWIKLAQGLDPFDKNNWYRTKIYSDSPYLTEIADIQEQKQREWTGAQERTSMVRMAPETPAASALPVILDNESWSFTFTPDVRYGTEPLYQAFQLHTRHLHRFDLRALARALTSAPSP